MPNSRFWLSAKNTAAQWSANWFRCCTTKLDPLARIKECSSLRPVFQSGAIKYAKAHGIALVSIIDGAASYETRSAFPISTKPPACLNLPKFSLWHVGENDAGNISMKSLGRTDMEINEMLGD